MPFWQLEARDVQRDFRWLPVFLGFSTPTGCSLAAKETAQRKHVTCSASILKRGLADGLGQDLEGTACNKARHDALEPFNHPLLESLERFALLQDANL